MRLARVVVCALVLATSMACGSSNDGPGVASANGGTSSATPTPSASGDRQEQLRQFAQCMRDHGVDLPDPDPNGGPGMLQNLRTNDPAFQSAFTACQSTLPNGGQPPKLNPEQVEQYRVFAQCMRDHGVDVPDPEPDGTLRIGQGRFNLGDPNLQKALEACRDTLTGVFGGGR